MKLDVIEPEHLESLYYGNGYTLHQIGNIVGCGYTVIRNRMIEYDIPCRIRGRHKQVVIEPDLLWGLYWGNGYTKQQIANIFGTDRGTIKRRMIEYDIPRRSVGKIVTDFTFNDRQKQIFEGCMLGDGSLRWAGNNCYFSNGDTHDEYLLWLQKQLGIEQISSVKPHYIDSYAYDYRLETRVIPSIREQHIRWYPNGKGTRSNYHRKIIPKDIELTPTKLLFWYIGDGNYDKRDCVIRFTNVLIFDDWMMLSKKICKVIDVDDGISICKQCKDKNDMQRYLLRLNRIVTNKFFDMVDSLDFDIPECYQYKFGGVKK